MLNCADVDVVYIATPIGVHFSLTEQVLKAGKHAWCEKPLTCEYIETKSLISLAEKSNRMITESFMYLHHPQFHRVKKFVDESGQVHSVICRFGIPTLDAPGFRNDPKLCGGAFWDVGTYTISALLALLPNQHVTVLFSEVCQKENTPVDSEGRVLLRFSQGTTAYLEWGVGVAYKNEIDLWSQSGSFFTDKIFSKPVNYDPKYYLRDQNGNESLVHGERCEQFVEMFRNFVLMMDNEQEIATERMMILQRAQLMDNIINYKI
jgi:predicted dehydrogenase